MDLRDLRLLLDVVEEGSVQSAARKLGLSRSTLRRRLENLEADVGSPLLVSGISGVALTAAGAVVVEEGRVLLEHSQRLVARATAKEERASGTARIIIPIGIRRDMRLWLLDGLHKACPDLCIDARECEDPLSLLHDPFELMMFLGGAPPRGEWFSRVVIRLPFRLLASPAYLERAGTPDKLSDLSAHSFALWTGAGHSPNSLPLLDGGTVPVKPWFLSSDLELVMASAGRGSGLCLGPLLPDGEGLVPLLEDAIGAEVTVRTLSPHSTSSDARVRAVQEHINQFVATLPGE